MSKYWIAGRRASTMAKVVNFTRHNTTQYSSWIEKIYCLQMRSDFELTEISRRAYNEIKLGYTKILTRSMDWNWYSWSERQSFIVSSVLCTILHQRQGPRFIQFSCGSWKDQTYTNMYKQINIRCEQWWVFETWCIERMHRRMRFCFDNLNAQQTTQK